MLMKQRCVHRAAARGHAHAHAASNIFLASNPGLQKLGEAWRAFLDAHIDTCPPSGFFGRSGWSGEVHAQQQNVVPLAVKAKTAQNSPQHGRQGNKFICSCIVKPSLQIAHATASMFLTHTSETQRPRFELVTFSEKGRGARGRLPLFI